MPQEPAIENSDVVKKEAVVNPTNTPPKTITFKKTKFITILMFGILLAFTSIVGAYLLGQDSAKEKVSVKKEEVKDKKEDIPDLVEVGLGEEVKAKNGIAIELEEAKHDDAYEKQKEETKKYYEKNASQSAYLDSEYLKQSNLVLKVAVKNTTSKEVIYSPSSFRLKDSDDNQYTSGYGMESGTTQATTYSLNPGEVTKLSLSYIVPTSEEDFSLIYENVVINFSL
jgi:hypothetical protein